MSPHEMIEPPAKPLPEATKSDHGGPAFPFVSHGGQYFSAGMTLRDWFAGQALKALGLNAVYSGVQSGHVESRVRAAYKVADAMLSERAKASEPPPSADLKR